MEQKHILLSGGILILIVVGMFVFTFIKKQEISNTDHTLPPIAEEQRPSKYEYISEITAKHFYTDGTHTLIGEIDMPTPCDLLESEVLILESYPEQVIIDFHVVNHNDMCTQVITPQRFQERISVSENATFQARFEGEEVEFNLIPPIEGESLDDFELYIEG